VIDLKGVLGERRRESTAQYDYGSITLHFPRGCLQMPLEVLSIDILS